MRILGPLLAFASACGTGAAQNCSNTSIPGLVPLEDLGPGLYQGFAGGLYPGSSKALPVPHFVRGMHQAAQVVPRDGTGQPAPGGGVSASVTRSRPTGPA